MSRRACAYPANEAALWILVIIATLFFLRAAKTLLIPIALAALVSYALEPVVAWLERRRVPRLAGAAFALLIILGASVGGAYALRDDATELVEALPKAIERARATVLSRLGAGAEAIARVATGRETGGAEASRGADLEDVAGTSEQVTGSLVQRALGGVMAIAGQAVVVLFLIYFLLISGEHVRNRLVEIAGPNPERQRMTATVIGDINSQVQRYLLVLFVTAIIVGVATWGALAWVGVRHAAMWGILAGVLNSIPYFGPVIVCGGLFVAGLLQSDSLTTAFQMSGVALLVTSLEGWLLTPPLMGKVERMSSLAVFLGLVLWTWLWGEWGTLLAVPMLVIVKSIADHVEPFRPLGRLMAP